MRVRRLGDEHPVERIRVELGKFDERVDVSLVDRQEFELEVLDMVGEVLDG